jgi:hypothetical protein
MNYIEKADKIFLYTSYSKKKKIDNLLEINADIYCNSGIDSTNKERRSNKDISNYIFSLIKKLDFYLGHFLLYNTDR